MNFYITATGTPAHNTKQHISDGEERGFKIKELGNLLTEKSTFSNIHKNRHTAQKIRPRNFTIIVLILHIYETYKDFML